MQAGREKDETREEERKREELLERFLSDVKRPIFRFLQCCGPLFFSFLFFSFSQASLTADGICMDMRGSEFDSKVQEAKRFTREGISVRYVGVIWFGFQVLQLLPIRLHNKILCCVIESTMKHL
jgi:hypothetical protein